MRDKLARTLITAAAAFAVAAPLAAAAAASQAGGPTIKVGPKQHVRGFVNAKNSKAVIRVVCAGPASTGHPLSRQRVRVARASDPIAPNDGFTGSAATSIGAWLTWPMKVAPPPPVYIATFTSYAAMPIPTSITVPCAGSGEMLFLPAPGSRTVKAATVGVTFVNIGA
jgi:hypothetical protein